jgi:hypothetical protein
VSQTGRPAAAPKMPVSDAAVLAKTGRTWAQWGTVLDRAKASAMTHREIASLLHAKFGVGDWWAQMVTVGYERARGRRAVNETAQGFRAHVSRTVGASAKAVHRAWIDESARAEWLKGQRFTVRSSSAGKSVRLTWPDETTVEVVITAKGAQRSIVAVQHNKLTGAAAVRGAKSFWAARLDALRALLER